MNPQSPDIKLPAMDIDREGWWAIQHTDGWWCGTERGVTCYEDRDMARVALTILWQMDGGGKLNYRIKPCPGPTVPGDEVKFEKSAEQAILDYEKQAPRRIK